MKQPILYIKDKDDNYVQMEMFSDETITLTSKIQDVKDISKVFTDFSQPFTLPASKENNKVFQHWYNYNIDNGFNSRIKKDALLEIDYSPYKRGKVQLQSVKLKDNKPFSYSIVFYGNTVELAVEQMEFAENSIRYQTTLDFINSKIRGLLGAIRGE